jgi:hypothetical protein
MVKALCPAPHDLIERRARHILFDRPRQPNHQDGVVWYLRRSDDSEIESCDQCQPDSDGGDTHFPMAEGEPNRADDIQNRNNNPESNLAAYPQFVSKRILHRLN